MIVLMVISLIVAVCLVSSLLFYVFIRSRNTHSSLNNEKQQIIHSFKPSMNIITEKVHRHSSFRSSVSSEKSNCSSPPTNELTHKKPYRSFGSLFRSLTPAPSSGAINTLFPLRRPHSANWRLGSIVDPKQMALIQFSLPPTNNKYRRRSVAICNSIAEPIEHLLASRDATLPCLLAFSVTCLPNNQLKVQLLSLQSLPTTLQLHQLTIKIKLSPDGKEKSIQLKKLMENEIVFEESDHVLFSKIPLEKIREQSLSISVQGKDQAKKSVHLGHIGKIHFNQIKKFEIDCPVNFMHEVEKTKPSSVELLVALERTDDRHMRVDLQRIKGLKIDQKKLDAKCYLQVLLVDRHRPLSSKQSKFYRLNSSNFTLGEQLDFNILTYNSNNLDRLMLIFNIYSNCNSSNEYKCIARVKLGSAMFCSGSGIVHWQQFQARESFSMWHTLNKDQH